MHWECIIHRITMHSDLIVINTFRSILVVLYSLLWIQDTQVEVNYLIIWRVYLDQWVWWFHRVSWFVKLLSCLRDSSMENYFQLKWLLFIIWWVNSFQNNTTMTFNWELFWVCLTMQEESKHRKCLLNRISKIKRKREKWSRRSRMKRHLYWCQLLGTSTYLN